MYQLLCAILYGTYYLTCIKATQESEYAPKSI